MAKLTDDEKQRLAEHGVKVSAAIKAGDLHALDALHERDEIKKLDGRRRFQLADETVRELWEKNAGERVVFRVCRSIVRLMLYSADLHSEAMRRRVAETQILIDRLAGAEKRIGALESRPGVKYCGPWKGGEHREGDAVTFDGNLFIARETTNSKPATDQTWTLAVRKGRDAR